MKLFSNFNLLLKLPFWKVITTDNSCEYSEFPLNLKSLDNGDCIIIDLGILFNSDAFDVVFQELFFQIKNQQKEVLLIFCNSLKQNKIQASLGKDIVSLRKRFFISNFNSLQDSVNYIHSFYLDEIGTDYDTIYSIRNWYESRCVLSLNGIKKLIKIIKDYQIYSTVKPKKVIVLDCDNTLWGGVIGEDLIDGVELSNTGNGEIFRDIQKFFKQRMNDGFLLCVCSKNNFDDVQLMFEKHHGMYLTLSDIVLFKVNWKEKSDNLVELSKELDLGLESFIFIDDNPLERDKVISRFPEILVPNLPENTLDWLHFLNDIDDFFKPIITNESNNKTSQYRQLAEFKTAKSNSNDPITFLKSISLKPCLIAIDENLISRTIELSSKTNQFNLNKNVLDRQNILYLLSLKEYKISLCHLTDKFSDHGIIGLVGYENKSNILVFDIFLLSCRILGRYFEEWILKTIIENESPQKILLKFNKTERNSMTIQIFKNLGFVLTDSDEYGCCFLCDDINKLNFKGVIAYE
jgi:FkbH-like protein